MLWFLVLSTLIIYLYMKGKEKHSFWERKGINYVKPKPILGGLKIFSSKPFAERHQELYTKFPGTRYHGTYLLYEPILVVKDPDLIKQITVKEFDHFMDHRTAVASDVDPIWGKNLFNIGGERWRDLRSTISPSFTSSKMRILYNLIDECARQFVDFFKKDQSEIVELEMKDVMSRFTNDVIATIAFGLKCDSLQDKVNKFYLMGKDVTNIGGLRIFKFFAHSISPTLAKLLKIRIISATVADYFSQIIKDTVKTREEKKIIRPDMIHLLLEAQKGRQLQEKEDLKVNEGFSGVSEANLLKTKRKEQITIEDIIAQAFLFFLAGFDTISTALNFVLYELAVNPDVQNKLREEIDSVEELTYETLFSMKYLDMVISEGLRKWPPAIVLDRKVTKSFNIEPVRPGEKPLHLEEGVICWVPIFGIHHDPEYYPEPEKFDPERFSEENRHKINPTMYLPFGAGPRNCIGSRFALLETKLLLFHVLKNFEVVPTKKTSIPVVLDPQRFGLQAKGGMWLGMKKIK